MKENLHHLLGFVCAAAKNAFKCCSVASHDKELFRNVHYYSESFFSRGRIFSCPCRKYMLPKAFLILIDWFRPIGLCHYCCQKQFFKRLSGALILRYCHVTTTMWIKSVIHLCLCKVVDYILKVLKEPSLVLYGTLYCRCEKCKCSRIEPFCFTKEPLKWIHRFSLGFHRLPFGTLSSERSTCKSS